MLLKTFEELLVLFWFCYVALIPAYTLQNNQHIFRLYSALLLKIIPDFQTKYNKHLLVYVVSKQHNTSVEDTH